MPFPIRLQVKDFRYIVSIFIVFVAHARTHEIGCVGGETKVGVTSFISRSSFSNLVTLFRDYFVSCFG